MDSVEATGKTVEEATELALKQLGAKPEEAIIEVVSRGKVGFLGFGSENARVRATRLPSEETAARKAKEIVDRLLGMMKVSVSAHIGKPPSEAPETIVINIDGEDSGLLIGRRGETMRSLQYVVNLLLSRQSEEGRPVYLDVEHYRERRTTALTALANRIADRVAASGRPITLEPMPPNDRRIIHVALANHPRVMTQSIGEGDERKVNISLKRNQAGGTGKGL